MLLWGFDSRAILSPPDCLTPFSGPMLSEILFIIGLSMMIPVFVKDNFAMPAVYAVARARKVLDKHQSQASLVMTGGYRTSGEICKTLAMGADAVAIATSAMIAIGCQQYRTCHTGNCPVGIATQKQNLRDRFSVDDSFARFVNYVSILKMEIDEITRATGKNDVHSLGYDDLITTNIDISTGTGIEHA